MAIAAIGNVHMNSLIVFHGQRPNSAHPGRKWISQGNSIDDWETETARAGREETSPFASRYDNSVGVLDGRPAKALSRVVPGAAIRGANQKLAAAVEAYFADFRRVLASGGATDERSSYGLLGNPLNSVGKVLSRRVFRIAELAD